MGVNVVRPLPTPADVVHPSFMGADATRLLVVRTHRPWVPMLSGLRWPTLLVRPVVALMLRRVHPGLPKSRSAPTSQYAAVCTGVQVQTPVETLTNRSLLLLGRRTMSP